MSGKEGQKRLEVRIKVGDSVAEFSGAKDEVWTSLNKYLTEIVGPLEIAAKLSGSTDLESLATLLTDKVLIRDGVVSVVTGGEAKLRILYCLAAAYLGRMLCQLDDDRMTPRRIAEATGMDERVVRARLSELWRKRLVERDEAGRYRFIPTAMKILNVKMP
ncbi:MAG: hypothetical protein QW756_07735 [Nitrososphaerota archaeon]